MSVNIESFTTWLTMVAGAHDDADRGEFISRSLTEHPEACPCCIINYLVGREIARGHGADVVPLVLFDKPEVRREH